MEESNNGEEEEVGLLDAVVAVAAAVVVDEGGERDLEVIVRGIGGGISSDAVTAAGDSLLVAGVRR